MLAVALTPVPCFACRESLVVFATATELARDGAAQVLRGCGGTGRTVYGSVPAAGVVARNEGGAWVLCRPVANLAADFRTGW